MRIPVSSPFLCIIILVTILISFSNSIAQRITNPDSLSKNPFGWNQEERELRDFGRFGQFILEGARINGKTIVPDDWLQAATHSEIDKESKGIQTVPGRSTK